MLLDGYRDLKALESTMPWHERDLLARIPEEIHRLDTATGNAAGAARWRRDPDK